MVNGVLGDPGVHAAKLVVEDLNLAQDTVQILHPHTEETLVKEIVQHLNPAIPIIVVSTQYE